MPNAFVPDLIIQILCFRWTTTGFSLIPQSTSQVPYVPQVHWKVSRFLGQLKFKYFLFWSISNDFCLHTSMSMSHILNDGCRNCTISPSAFAFNRSALLCFTVFFSLFSSIFFLLWKTIEWLKNNRIHRNVIRCCSFYFIYVLYHALTSNSFEALSSFHKCILFCCFFSLAPTTMMHFDAVSNISVFHIN